MPSFEFILQGPPISLNVKNHNPKRYKKWIGTVRASAQNEWSAFSLPTANEVTVTILNFYTATPPDVDNIIKPILDALNNLVYQDDKQVYEVTSRRHNLNREIRGVFESFIISETIGRYPEWVYVRAAWEEE